MVHNDTIIALATPPGTAAIAVIRISGDNAIDIVSPCFKPVKKRKLLEQESHTVHLGHIVENNQVLDKVLVSVFRAPNTYTGEDIVEISCHGSTYIQEKITQLFLRNGCRMATVGEFTLRAFLNGKMDLSQAEAVADLIESDSEASHQIALQQMRGGFSNSINILRDELINFASLIELELDFSQEDVEFADRTKLSVLLDTIGNNLKNLIDSFTLGNVIKKGVPVAIVGAPNVGKSTLLNALLNEDRAIVSAIPGTTRDTVEDQLSIGGINFRFIDTAGLRKTSDAIEEIGIKKTHDKIAASSVLLYLFDANNVTHEAIKKMNVAYEKKHVIIAINKIDEATSKQLDNLKNLTSNTILISAKEKRGINDLKESLLKSIKLGAIANDTTIVTNSRHYSVLVNALEEIDKVKDDMKNEVSSDLIAISIRQAIYHLGEITGTVTTDDLLGNIFSNFCIGK